MSTPAHFNADELQVFLDHGYQPLLQGTRDGDGSIVRVNGRVDVHKSFDDGEVTYRVVAPEAEVGDVQGDIRAAIFLVNLAFDLNMC